MSKTYWRWAHGWCPCCGGDIDEWIDGTLPEAIGEGVMLCGRCVANDHAPRDSDLAVAMLEAIARRTEEPIERLQPGSWINCRASP